MKTINLVEGLDYPEPIQDEVSTPHAILCEIISRLQELETLSPCTSANGIPFGARTVLRLGAIYRRSPRAYRLLLDMISLKASSTHSLANLAERGHSKLPEDCKLPHTRQSWLQSAQEDVKIVKEVWREVGEVMEEVLRRRPHEAENTHE